MIPMVPSRLTLSTARIHGAIPRALAVAVIAVPKRRPVLETSCGRIIFVKRDVNSIKRMRIETELATGWCTTIEQTALDLANRPKLIEGLVTIVEDAARSLFFRSSSEKLNALMEKQRRYRQSIRGRAGGRVVARRIGSPNKTRQDRGRMFTASSGVVGTMKVYAEPRAHLPEDPRAG